MENVKEKFSFDVEKLSNDINKDNFLNLSYVCFSVKELAYHVVSKIYDLLGVEIYDYEIFYKFSNKKHRVAFQCGNAMFTFNIVWKSGVFGGDALFIENLKVQLRSNFKNLSSYDYIEDVLLDEEVE